MYKFPQSQVLGQFLQSQPAPLSTGAVANLMHILLVGSCRPLCLRDKEGTEIREWTVSTGNDRNGCL